MLAPIFAPIFMLISPILVYFVSPCFTILNVLSHLFYSAFSEIIQAFVSSGLFILSQLLKPFAFIPEITNFLFLPIWELVKLFFSLFYRGIITILLNSLSFLFVVILKISTPFRLLAQFFIYCIKNSFIYTQAARFFVAIGAKSWSIIIFSLQPKQLAGKLVSPFILGASKLLYILPSSWVDSIALEYTKLAGKKRHISDEEVAAATLFLAGLGIYIFGILIGGYFIRIILYLLYHFDLYDNELHTLSNIFVVFRDTNYTTFSWKPDGALHELGLLFTTIVIPIMIVFRIISLIISKIYQKLFHRSTVQRLKEKHEQFIAEQQVEVDEIRTPPRKKNTDVKKRKTNSYLKIDRTFSAPNNSISLSQSFDQTMLSASSNLKIL